MTTFRIKSAKVVKRFELYVTFAVDKNESIEDAMSKIEIPEEYSTYELVGSTHLNHVINDKCKALLTFEKEV